LFYLKDLCDYIKVASSMKDEIQHLKGRWRFRILPVLLIVLICGIAGIASAGPLEATFTATPTSGQVRADTGYLSVYFNLTNQTQPNLANLTWVFGDGGVVMNQYSPTHDYYKGGVYHVTLTLRNISDPNDIVTSTKDITVIPRAMFDVSNATSPHFGIFGFANITLFQFNDLSKGEDLPSGTNWTWDFEDGNISYVQNPVHEYYDAGEWNVTLNLTVNGQINSTNTSVWVNPFPTLTVNPAFGNVTFVYLFNGTRTGGAGVLTRTMNWRDGNTTAPAGVGNFTNYGHKYNTAGIYHPILNVTGNDGTNGTVFTTVAVTPSANYTYTPLHPVEKQVVTFDAGGSTGGPGLTFLWDFGDSTPTSDHTTPQHVFEHAGVYNVTVTVTGGGLSESMTKTINVDSGGLYPLTAGINGNTFFRADKYAIPQFSSVTLRAYSTRSILKDVGIDKFKETIGTEYQWEFIGMLDPVNHHLMTPWSANYAYTFSPIIHYAIGDFRDNDVYTVILYVRDSRDIPDGTASFIITKPRLIVVRTV
jgi:PKD repeat protein